MPWFARNRWCQGGVLAVALVGCVIAWFRSPSPLNPLGFSNLEPPLRYVGDAACANCHRTIAFSYARTGMARSWTTPARTQVIEDFSAPAAIIDEATGYRYQVVREGERWLQREWRVDADGQVVHRHQREVAYVLGSGIRGRSYVSDSNGYLTLMPLAWYSRAKKWDLSPGYRGTQVRFSREVGSRCIVCHNNHPDYVWGSNSRYGRPLPGGIGCERCHGPGGEHVERQSGTARSFGSAGDRTIVNPARLPSDLQHDVCLQCHLETNGGSVFRRGVFDFQPGRPLGEYRPSFEFQHASDEQLGAVSHGPRMFQSRCFTESGRRLTCTVCHDPHVTTSETPRSYFNSRCATCHATGSCTRQAGSIAPAEAAAHRADDCVACHMPHGEPVDIQHTVTTDHWIRRRPGPAASRSQSVRRRRDGPLAGVFHATELGDQAIAHIVFGIARRDDSHVARGMTLLGQAAEPQPRNLRWQAWLALGAAHHERPDRAATRLESLLARVDDWRQSPLDDQEVTTAYVELAQTYLRQGKPDEAAATLERLLRVAPDCMPAYELAARVYVGSRRHADAIRVARAGLERNPANASLWWTLGWKQYDFEHQPREALASLQRALELDPTHLETHVVLSQVYEALGRVADSETALRQALAHNADFVPAKLAQADLWIRHQRWDEAVPLLESVLEQSPGNVPALQLLRAARKAQGAAR